MMASAPGTSGRAAAPHTAPSPPPGLVPSPPMTRRSSTRHASGQAQLGRSTSRVSSGAGRPSGDRKRSTSSIRSEGGREISRGPANDGHDAVLWELEPNPLGNLGLQNAVTSYLSSTENATKVWIGALAIETDYIPKSIKRDIKHALRQDEDSVLVEMCDDVVVGGYVDFCKSVSSGSSPCFAFGSWY